MNKNMLSETPITSAYVKKILEERQKKGELTFRAQKTYDHLQQIGGLDYKKAEELYKKLEALEISRMRDQYLVKLVDTLPTTEKDAKTILSGFNVSFNSKDLKAMVDVIKDYA
ncbi:hypothetical protein GF342_04445 [Candidatus Woesearchaeota archaeon]|nr:hypothetical protein [Candidatus Woesearchaeota archaeon]